MYQIALCDDEEKELNKVELLLQGYMPDFTGGGGKPFEIRRFMDSETLLLQMKEQEYQPDIILMDIYMQEELGIETVRKLRCMGKCFQTIFLTASEEFALEAFEVDAADYLLKPVTEERLFVALDKAVRRLAGKRPQHVLLQTEGAMCKIAFDDIMYCEAQRKYKYVYLKEGGSICLRMTMPKLFELLEPAGSFAKLGVSYIVNMEHIKRLETRVLHFDNGKEIFLPRGSYRELREQYFSYYINS